MSGDEERERALRTVRDALGGDPCFSIDATVSVKIDGTLRTAKFLGILHDGHDYMAVVRLFQDYDGVDLTSVHPSRIQTFRGDL